MNQSIYDRITQFSFDEGDEELTFADRLAKENGWTPTYTDRVIEEYKRFVFLAVVAGHPVTPSDQVDQVWHLHLTYTRSYWDRFCGQVLGRPLHHGPTRGGSEESRKFKRWYQDTRESYVRFFSHEPPSDIWPDAAVRFGDNLHFERTNTKQNWVIAKPRLSGKLVKIVLFALVAIAFWILALAIKAVAGSGGDHPPTAHDNRSTTMSSFIDFARDHPIFTVFAGAIVACAVYGLIFGNKCPKCKRRRAMERTLVREKTGWFSLLDSGRELWQCRYCDYRDWREPSSGCGGCG